MEYAEQERFKTALAGRRLSPQSINNILRTGRAAQATAAIELFWQKLRGESLGAPQWEMSANSLILWCRLRGLNSRPSVYKTAALPLS